MIDLDLLDDQLEQALSHEVRSLRGVSPLARGTDWNPNRPAPRQSLIPPTPPEPRQPDEDPWTLDWHNDEADDDEVDEDDAEEMDVAEVVEADAEPEIEAEAEVEAEDDFELPAFEPELEPEPEPAPAPMVVAKAEPKPFRRPIETLEKDFEYEFKERPSAERKIERKVEKKPERPTERRSERRSDRTDRTDRAERAERRPRIAAPRPAALDRLREAAAALSGPDGAPRDLGIAEHARAVPDLVARGEMAAADQHIATHASLTSQRGSTHDKVDAATWEAMRSLLDGQRDDALDALDAVRRLGERSADPQAANRSATLRFWIGLEWGSEAEQYDLLDYCREQAYRHNDMTWRGALAVQLARLGRGDEAAREFDAVASQIKQGGVSLDVLTDLAEVAFLLGDAHRAKLVEERILSATVSLVTVGPAWVCKGSVARFAAHVAAAKRAWDDADRHFASALKAHRRIHAEPLVARTLFEWGTSLRGRNDELARQYLDEAAEVAARLRLTISSAVAA